MKGNSKKMFQAVVQFRDPHQQSQSQQHVQNQKPPLHPVSSSSSSSTDSSTGPPPAGSSTTLPNRRSRRKKSLLYQVLMSPLRKKSGSTNTLNTIANNTSNQQQQVQGSNVSHFKINSLIIKRLNYFKNSITLLFLFSSIKPLKCKF